MDNGHDPRTPPEPSRRPRFGASRLKKRSAPQAPIPQTPTLVPDDDASAPLSPSPSPFGPRSFGGGRVQVFGCSPGCLVMSLVVSVVLTLLLNILI